MTSSSFTTTTHAKWILAGEHAVIRGHGALVFPISRFTLTLTYEPRETPEKTTYIGEHAEAMHLFFWSVLESGCELIDQDLDQLKGHFTVENNIPVGVGLGASAALCVAVGRWFVWRELITLNDLYDFARKLENLFHTQSSGLDIAAVIANQGIYFKAGAFEPIDITWQPHWYLSHSGTIGLTSNCVNQVNTLWKTQPDTAQEIDNHMRSAVEQAREALSQDTPASRNKLSQSINNARICFARWGLACGKIDSHINQLLSAGAIAAKPTGSGDGGYVLSLWKHSPPEHLAEKLILLGSQKRQTA